MVGYGYFIENRTLPLGSHRDLGLRYVVEPDDKRSGTGASRWKAARQSPYADGATANHASYALVEGAGAGAEIPFAWAKNAWVATATTVFATPLADAARLQRLGRPLPRRRRSTACVTATSAGTASSVAVEANVVAHDFAADHGGADFGTSSTPRWRWRSRRTGRAGQVADFNGDEGPLDVAKAWLSLEYQRLSPIDAGQGWRPRGR
jgi:hypothetical protein